MPKYVRRQSLSQRLAAYLNPYDFLLWLSEELESQGWDQLEKEWAIPIGLGLNAAFLIARANTSTRSTNYDDVFGEVESTGWLAWLATFCVHFLTLIALVNAAYTFTRKKHYRLFETSIDAVPSTPSAHRVRVDSSPVSSSPLRFLSDILGSQSAQSRAHPNAARDVWQVALWDPLPISLQLFCYFSPGHVLIYCLFLPTVANDPRPSITVFTALVLAFLFTVQLSFLRLHFSRQSKDSAYISKEVLHEYDMKYVRPRTQPLYRDVGTQFTEQASYSLTRDERWNTVETYTPMVVINRGFKTNANPNYSQHVDPDGLNPDALRHRLTSNMQTPAKAKYDIIPARPLTAVKQPEFRATPRVGDGGSLGIYSHAASPLRKSQSTTFANRGHPSDVAMSRISLSPEKRALSPEKRMSMPSSGLRAQRLSEIRGSRHRRESGRF